jgi:hypothetical protein
MWQLIILIAVILLVYITSRLTGNKRIESTNNNVEIVKCCVCDLNTPSSESIRKGEYWFCSEECVVKNDI